MDVCLLSLLDLSGAYFYGVDVWNKLLSLHPLTITSPTPYHLPDYPFTVRYEVILLLFHSRFSTSFSIAWQKVAILNLITSFSSTTWCKLFVSPAGR